MTRFSFVPPPTGVPRPTSGWRARLARDPLPLMLREGSSALVARIRRDLIDDEEAPGPAEIHAYTEVRALTRKQEADGGFAPRGPEKGLGGARFSRDLGTLRAIERLADMGVPAGDAVLLRAAERLLGSQAPDGGIGDLALAATPNGRARIVALHFHGWAVAALCRAGLDGDPKVDLAFRYLLERRQDDGGWAWRGVRAESAARPSSHLVTGMVLRAFAASLTRRGSREARRAAELLATRFLQPDRYPDRRDASHWENLAEPRFYTDVLDALDVATAVGLGKENSGVRTAEAYLRSRQAPDGYWYPGPPGKAGQGARDREAARWLTLRVLLVLRRVN